MTTVADALEKLWDGTETLAFWLHRYPSLRERVRAVSPAAAAYTFNTPRLVLSTKSTTATAVVYELADGGNGGLLVNAWKTDYLGQKDLFGSVGPLAPGAKTKAENLALLAKLAAVEWPNVLEEHDWTPARRDSVASALGVTKTKADKLWNVLRTSELLRVKQEQGELATVHEEPAVLEQLLLFGNPQRIIDDAQAATTREQLWLLIEEASLTRRVELLPLLYSLAWQFKSGTFPGMPSAWGAAWQKAAQYELNPSEKAVESWLTDLALSVVKYRARRVPFVNFATARAHWYVTPPADFWLVAGWPKGYPSLEVQIGDGPEDGRDIRKPLRQQNLDELEPEFNDFFGLALLSVVTGIMGLGLGKILAGELLSGLGAATEGLLADSLSSGLGNAIQAGTSDALGYGDANLGEAFLTGAAGPIKENPMGMFGDSGFFGEAVSFIKDGAAAYNEIQQALNANKGSPSSPPPPSAPAAPAPISVPAAAGVSMGVLVAVGLGVLLLARK